MALQIVNQGPPPEEIAERLRESILAAIEDAHVEVRPQGPGHFEISVVSRAFEGQSRVKQHQLVYGAITDLMAGPNAPVHAVDRLDCAVPDPS